MGSSIVFLGDQFPMPSQQGLGSDNAGDLGQNLSSQRFGLYRPISALIVIEAHSPVTELFSKRPIFLAKVVNDLQLAVVHPPGNSDQHKPERVDPSLRIQNPLSTAEPQYRTTASSCRSSFRAIRELPRSARRHWLQSVADRHPERDSAPPGKRAKPGFGSSPSR